MNEKQCIELLKKYAPDEERFKKVLAHSKAVQKVAMRIAEDIVANGHHVDIKFLINACLLHDIGRFKCPPGKYSYKHGVIGGDILRKEELPEYARVAERHLGVGITRNDILTQNLELPAKDYIPKTIEEKIIAYADNLIFGTRVGTIKEVIERFRKELGEEYGKRVIELHNEIEKLRGKKNFL